MGEKAGEEV
jgi:hypothetical protein